MQRWVFLWVFGALGCDAGTSAGDEADARPFDGSLTLDADTHDLGAADAAADMSLPHDAAVDAAWDDAAPDAAPDSGLPPGCISPPGVPTFDAYGGDTRVELEATGFFRLDRLCGRHWLVTPAGHPFFSTGVNSTRPNGSGTRDGRHHYAEAVDAKYESRDAWADATVERLRGWGWNTIGSWSENALLLPRMPTTINLNMAQDDWQTGEIADYFSAEWVEATQLRAQAAAEFAQAPNLVGYFIDNEIRWGLDWRGTQTLLELYLGLEADARGKQVAVDFLFERLGDLEGINAMAQTDFADLAEVLATTEGWGALNQTAGPEQLALTDAFIERVARQYFEVTTTALRAVDPNHLILGNREVAVATRLTVLRVAAEYVDVLSLNNYVFVETIRQAALRLSGALDPADALARLHAEIDLPILITEFGFRARDSGLPNTWPPIYPVLETQEARADAFEAYVGPMQRAPWIVGYHWFQWVDQPPEGRFDGEDNNWGLVNEADQPYTVLTDRMRALNARIWDQLHVAQ